MYLLHYSLFSHCDVSVDEVELDDREPLDGEDVDRHNMEDDEDEDDGLCQKSFVVFVQICI